MLQALRDDAQGKGLGSGDRLLAALPVGQNAWKLRNLSNPATIVLALNLNGKTHHNPPGSTTEVGGPFRRHRSGPWSNAGPLPTPGVASPTVGANLARVAAHCQGQTGCLRFASAGAARLLYAGMTRARDLLYVTYQTR
jgi:hypothetical protein